MSLKLYLASPLGVIPFEFRLALWRQKTRLPGLSWGVVCMIRCLAVLKQYLRVTDRHAHDDCIYRAILASRGKNGLTCQHQTWYT